MPGPSVEVKVDADMIKEVKSIFKDIGVELNKDYHGIEPDDGRYYGPYYIIYRSNYWGSGNNGAGGLVVDFKVNKLKEATRQYGQKKDTPTHAYGICDSTGHIIHYNARLTSSFEGTQGIKYCKSAIRKYGG